VTSGFGFCFSGFHAARKGSSSQRSAARVMALYCSTALERGALARASTCLVLVGGVLPG